MRRASRWPGELTGSIAHEINQPLGAILSNADAADLILESGTDRRDELREILADIRRDDLRASEVIHRLRALLAKHEVERQPFELNEVVERSGTHAARRSASDAASTLEIRPAPMTATMVGDRIQIQQVLINLVLNAMDAVADVPEDRRTVVVSIESGASGAVIAVRDRGHGIAPEHLPKLFESFFSTKRTGHGAWPVDCAHDRRSPRWPHLGRERSRRGRGVPCRIARGCRERRPVAGDRHEHQPADPRRR